MVPAPVTHEFKDSPITHEEQSLRKTDAFALQHFKTIKPAYGSSRNKKFLNKILSPHNQNFRVPYSTRRSSLFLANKPQENQLHRLCDRLPPNTEVDPTLQPSPTLNRPTPQQLYQEFSSTPFPSQSPGNAAPRDRARGNTSTRYSSREQNTNPESICYTRPNADRMGAYNPRSNSTSL